MKTSQRGVNLIKRFEGRELTAYKDSVGVWTIGYGHTSAAGAPKVKSGLQITPTQAEAILRRDLHQYEQGVREAVTVALSQSQFDALVSFAFNVGVGALKRSTLRRKLNNGDYYGAAKEFLRWNRAGRKVLRGLTRRRKAERKLFLKGTQRKSLAQSRTVWGAATSGTGTTLSLVSEEVTNASQTLTGLADFSTYLGIAGAVMAVAGAGLAIYARIEDHKHGKS